MKTVRVNLKAALSVLVVFGLLVVFVFHMMPLSDANDQASPGRGVILTRDQLARAEFERKMFENNRTTYSSAESMSVSPQDEVVTTIMGNRTLDDAEARNFIKGMMLHAWNGYKTYAWGKNEVRPVTKEAFSQGIFGGAESGLAATIVDSLDTLLVMGLAKEYKEGRDFVKEKMDISKVTGTLSVFETTIRFIGGLLSAYAMTKEQFYADKAKSIADLLLKAFDTPYGIPKSSINPASGYISNYGWAGDSSILSEIGSLHLEFLYLSEVTGNPLYRRKVQAVRDRLDKTEKVQGLYPNYISPATGKWTGSHVSLGAMGDSFYEYLLKSYVQTNRTDQQAWRMYSEVIRAVEKNMVRKSKGGLTYVAEWRNGILEHKMGHLACFCVGMFALQSSYENDQEESQRVMDLAEELGNTCHESYIRSNTRIGPEMFYFNMQNEATATFGDHGYVLRPEVIEGWFYLWRLTGKQKYKEWVWDAVMAIEKYCRKEAGYAGLDNVYSIDPSPDDVQQSFFLAETLKYAYLTFTDGSLPLDKWVFNTEAHPFPILRNSTKSG